MDENKSLAVRDNPELMEKVLLEGDLSQLKPAERMQYYSVVCNSLGLNPATRPFDYIKLNGKLTLYAKKDATEQLRKNNGVSITELSKEWKDNLFLYIVTAHAVDKHGRTDAATGAVSVKGLAGDNLANAVMKAETKAKRRVTLSICGMGWMDESEISSIKDAQPVVVTETGDIIEGTVTSSVSQPEPPAPEPVATVKMWYGDVKPRDEKVDSETAVKFAKPISQKMGSVVHVINHIHAHFGVPIVEQMTGPMAIMGLTWEQFEAMHDAVSNGKEDPRWYSKKEEPAKDTPKESPVVTTVETTAEQPPANGASGVLDEISKKCYDKPYAELDDKQKKVVNDAETLVTGGVIRLEDTETLKKFVTA